HKYIAGIDEAGRGALFGPVVAVSVVFPPEIIIDSRESWLTSITDSKCLSPTQRLHLARIILAHARSIGVGISTHREIDRINIYWASLEAMKRAVSDMTIQPDYLLVDGFPIKGIHHQQRGVPQGDRKCTLIAAASILAKVLRDNVLFRLDKEYQGYGLARHKGYATEAHYEALELLGPSEMHRHSFKLGRQLKFW
ncbi:ribonuclease HII, partial [Acidobacteriota bacterium]